ncbi:hypothetical protein [Armatimonas sp.]|uniref:hypothetical protein n=1 Tax=Armatimonas sp. TaxID=1872638 RepID=UPI0037533ED6
MTFVNFRKIVTTTFLLSVTIISAFGEGIRPTDILLPGIVSAGSMQPCVVTVEGAGVVHIHSIPAGVVDMDVPVHPGANYVNVAFSASYVEVVTVYATMDGSSQVVGTTTIVLPH